MLNADLLNAWNELDNASLQILNTQPAEMTKVAERLEAARTAMREVIYKEIRKE